MNSSNTPSDKQNPDYKTVQFKSKQPEKKPPLKQKILQEVCKLALSKNTAYQFKDEELQKCGVAGEKYDRVREAITKAESAGQNVVFSFTGWLFAQVTNFIDSVFKVIIVAFVFLLSLQVPYLNEQANRELTESIKQADLGLEKHQETIREFTALMKKNKIKGVQLEQEIPQLKKDKEEAERWLQYKDRTVESVWREISKEPFHSQAKIADLKVIYENALANYRPGFPMTGQPYFNAGVIALLALIVYSLLQSLLSLSFKNYFRRLSLKHQLKKVL